MEWRTKEGYSNQVLGDEALGYFVSYNPGPPGNDSAETALVKIVEGGEQIFYILDGDFRDEYKNLYLQGWDKCLEFFEMMRGDFECIWSTVLPCESMEDVLKRLDALVQFVDDIARIEYKKRDV